METQSAPRLILTPLFKIDRIELDLHGASRDAVLEELVGKIPELATQPNAKNTLLRALQDREQLCSTGIGDGIALPHCRNALVGLVDEPVVVFGRHNQGISFGSVDNSPARLFFLLVAPNVSQHLQILGRLSRLLRDPKLRKALLAADKAEKVQVLIKDAESKM
jgi:mannitol/fructose-specific phosphotransferase system IIA component (Ntr-type)